MDTLEIETGQTAQAAIIWLHGLGADGHDFAPIVPELDLPLAVRFVFPHAPIRPVTVNGGMPMRAWYDFGRPDLVGSERRDDIADSVALVHALVERERDRGIDTARIVLAGFSQGGAIALHAALSSAISCAGVLALSTYLPCADSLSEPHRQAILMAHGTYDPVIPIAAARRAADWLEARGCQVEWHEYPMGHSVCGEEITDIRDFLIARFAASLGREIRP